MKERLKCILKGRVVVVGIGHALRGDDALGPVLIQRLDGCLNACCMDAGSAPENYLGKIVKERPDTVLLVDAVHMGKKPGAWDILKEADIARSGFSTHDLSPKMFLEYLKKESGAAIYLLGIQPASLTLGDEMTADVRKTLGRAEAALKEVLACMKPT